MGKSSKKIDIVQLQRNLDVKKCLSSLNINFDDRRGGGELILKCVNPSHNDKNPSLQMNARGDEYNGVWTCNPCGWRGSFIKFVMYVTGWTFKQSLDFLTANTNEILYIDDSASIIKDREEALFIESNKRFEFTPSPISFEYIPFENKDDWDPLNPFEAYMINRRVSPQVAYELEVGYSNYFQYGKMNMISCIVVPVRYKGICCSFLLRSTFDKAKLYPPDAPNKYFFYNFDFINYDWPTIIVEGFFDVAVIKTAIFFLGLQYNVIASWSNNPTEYHIELLKTLPGEKIVMPDRDGIGGKILVDKIAEPLCHEHHISIANIPLGKDPGQCTFYEIDEALKNREIWIDHVNKNMFKIGKRYIE